MEPDVEQWHRVGPIDAIAPGRAMRVDIGDRALAVGRVGDRFFAVDDACPHSGWSLAYGCLEGRRLVCSLHNWAFDVFTGECVLFDGKLASHPVRIEDGILEVFLRAAL